MNSSVTKFVTIKGSVLNSGQYKKSKRKRSRNKYRNFNLRKKRFKKVYCTNETNSPFSTFNKNCEKIMSNWYWSNYKKAIEWQDRHKIAHWKACALALFEENRCLVQIINSMKPKLVPEGPVTESNLPKADHYNKQGFKGNSVYFINGHSAGNSTQDLDTYGEEAEEEEEEEEQKVIGDGEDDDDDIEFEMSEEMMQFFEQSYKHKMDLQKLKEEELIKSTEQEIKEIQINKVKRSTEMTLLYGEGASMITGMETAIQLSFDKYCDTKSPQYWPNIPFRL